MSNDPKVDLIYAILAMDAYNRGYGAGISDLKETGQIGSYSIRDFGLGEQEGWESAGFYALAYSDGTETVISYRGSDKIGDEIDTFLSFVTGRTTDNDINSGYGVALGYPDGPQARLAIEFYKAVAQSTGALAYNEADIVLTGHSLGGGLAGYAATAANDSQRAIERMAA